MGSASKPVLWSSDGGARLPQPPVIAHRLLLTLCFTIQRLPGTCRHKKNEKFRNTLQPSGTMGTHWGESWETKVPLFSWSEFILVSYIHFVIQIHQIERVQKTATHIILGDKYSSYKNGLKQLNLDTLRQRRQNLCKKFTLKAVQHEKFNSWFQTHTSTYKNRTRSTKDKYKPVNPIFIGLQSKPGLSGRGKIIPPDIMGH